MNGAVKGWGPLKGASKMAGKDKPVFSHSVAQRVLGVHTACHGRRSYFVATTLWSMPTDPEDVTQTSYNVSSYPKDVHQIRLCAECIGFSKGSFKGVLQRVCACLTFTPFLCQHMDKDGGRKNDCRNRVL